MCHASTTGPCDFASTLHAFPPNPLAPLQAPITVLPRVFLGNAVAADSHHLLQHLGVTHVLNAAQELQLTPDDPAHMFVVLRVAIRDEEEEDVATHFRLVGGRGVEGVLTLLGAARLAARWRLLEIAAAKCAVNLGGFVVRFGWRRLCECVSLCCTSVVLLPPWCVDTHVSTHHDRRGTGSMRRCVLAGLCWCTATRARAAV